MSVQFSRYLWLREVSLAKVLNPIFAIEELIRNPLYRVGLQYVRTRRCDRLPDIPAGGQARLIQHIRY